MEKNFDILLVGQTPPPFHGQAVITGMLFDHDWGDLRVKRLRMAFSDNIESVGEASWVKVWRLMILILKTWKIALMGRPRVLYYLPASPNITPVVRDVIYLGMVRWLFSKTIFHYHAGGLDDFYKESIWTRRLTKWVYLGADCSIDVNVTKRPSGKYFQARKNAVVMNGLEVGKAKRLRSADTPIRLLYVGLLCEPKGLLDLIEVAKILKKAGLTYEFSLVGGWESECFKNRFDEKMKREGVGEMFRCEGVKNGMKKWQAYADADVFVFPSRHPTETFGLVLVEAMAFGLPVVATRWRGVPHVVGEGGCAILCDADEPKQFASAIEKLASNRSLREQMALLAKRRYSEKFTKDRFLKNMKNIFLEVLSS